MDDLQTYCYVHGRRLHGGWLYYTKRLAWFTQPHWIYQPCTGSLYLIFVKTAPSVICNNYCNLSICGEQKSSYMIFAYLVWSRYLMVFVRPLFWLSFAFTGLQTVQVPCPFGLGFWVKLLEVECFLPKHSEQISRCQFLVSLAGFAMKIGRTHWQTNKICWVSSSKLSRDFLYTPEV